jgi:WS/DGAT/MGAT family acyltransferase
MEELTGLDARFLYSETPTAHMHTMKVVVVDVDGRTEALTPASLAAAIAERLDRMPGLRRRVLPVPHNISHPVWIEAPFDPADHIRWCRAAPPGDRVALATLVAQIAGAPLPRHRPLWELLVVEGLADGRIAFVVKLHHALADGVAAAAMLENVFQGDVDRVVVEPARPESVPTPVDLSRLAWRNRLARVRRLPAMVGRNVGGLASVRRARRSHAVRPPTLFSEPRTALNVSLSDQRTYAVTDLPMRAVLDIRSHQGVTVNDVFLAICGGALRRHLGPPPVGRKGLVAGVPIGAPGDGARLTGNHLDHMLVALRTDLEDPVDRLHAIAAGSAAARAERAALGLGLFEDRAGHTPPGLYPMAIRLWASSRLANRLRPPLHLITSNVAGPLSTLRLDGGVVAELWSVGPILEGIGLNLTAWSYDGVLRVSALGCPESLPEPWALMGAIDEALAELAAASHRSGVARHRRPRPLIGAVGA